MIDDQFLPLHRMIAEMASFPPEIVDQEAGVRSYIHLFEIETPIELDVFRDDEGNLRVGSAPPLYRVDTTFRPWFHNIRFKAHLLSEAQDGE